MKLSHAALVEVLRASMGDLCAYLPHPEQVLEDVAAAIERAEGEAVSSAQLVEHITTAPRCRGCGTFLSAIRVEMRIDRCSRCDGKGRRA